MHKKWSNALLGEDIVEEGFVSIEIDESEILGKKASNIGWLVLLAEKLKMLYFIVYYLIGLNDLYFRLIKKILTNEYEDDKIPKIQNTKTFIYSDCFSTYQIKGFRNLGYFLKSINNSNFFGYGLFHTNIIESLWNNLKKKL